MTSKSTKNETIYEENKVKKYINKVMNSIAFPILIGIIILLKTFFFYNNTIAIDEPLELEIIIGTIFFIIMMICFLCVLPNRARTICGIVINILFSMLLFGDNIYYTYSSNVLSVAQITNLQYGEEILSTLPMVIEFKQILYFVDIIILAVLFVLKLLKIVKKSKKTKKQITVKIIVGIIGIIIFCVIGVKYVEKGKQK